jgi:hypothetical protein
MSLSVQQEKGSASLRGSFAPSAGQSWSNAQDARLVRFSPKQRTLQPGIVASN